MIRRIRNGLKFYLERLILRGATYRLLVIAALIGLISAGAGLLVLAADTGFSSPGEAIWWAFLRLTDPGYLGDDKGLPLRSVSTILTVLGYVLFMGSLIAIMTQWLNQTITTLEKGLTPIVQKNHILILGWTNRTPIIVRELVLSEGRVKRFLRRHGARRLRLVILSQDLSAEQRHELQDYLGKEWNEGQVIFRSGSPLRIEHLRRVDYLNAAAIILPGSDFLPGGSEFADMRAIKTLLSISVHGPADKRARLPLLVAEIFDARKVQVAREAYAGTIEILASDSVLSLLVTQNVRHRWLSHVYAELLTHAGGNQLYIRNCPELEGRALQDLSEAFPRAVVLGALCPQGPGYRPRLNPPEGFVLSAEDRLVFVARTYEETEPLAPVPLRPGRRGSPARVTGIKKSRRLVLLGWNDTVPALCHEFDQYENEHFEIDILSSVPAAQRRERMAKYALDPQRVTIRHLEGDYSAPSDLARIEPAGYDNIILLASDWLASPEEADARTILGYRLVQRLLAGEDRKPEILVELLDPENQALLQSHSGEVLVSPMILSHILAHVALRPELNLVFQELFSSGGAEIFFRPVASYELVGQEQSFREIQEAVALHGETALGVRIEADLAHRPGGVHLNPEKDRRWMLRAEDEVVVVATYV